jgi:ketosteroid isomerase-like protein
MKHFYCIKFLGLIALLLLAACSRDDESTNMNQVEEAVHAVYAAINAKDADALIDLILAEGYSEYDESGGAVFMITPQYLRDVLPDITANWVAQDIDVSVIGQSAVVTGYRAGSSGTSRLSMLWVRDSGKWLLAHVHLSPSVREHAEREVREVHNQFFDGMLKEDTALLDRILSSDVTFGFPGGNIMARADFLALLSGGELFYDSADHHSLQARIYGDAAVVNGKSTLAYRFQGESMTESLTYTATYVMNESSWQLAAWQSTVPMLQ